jgi:HlyD family secretion protein
MRRFGLVVVLAVLIITGSVLAQENQTLSLVSPQPVRSGVISLATVRIGSRLSAYIAEWGTSKSGEPLDVGMSVEKGRLLFSIDQSTFKARVDSAQAAVGSAKAALDNLRAPTRKERLDALQATLNGLQARLKDRRRDEERYRRLVEVDKTMPLKSLEAVQLEVEMLKNDCMAAQARFDEAVAGPTNTEIAVAEARLKEAEAALATATVDLDDTVIAAPFDGVITKRMKNPGDFVSGQPLTEVLELTNTDLLEVELRMPEPYLALVDPGNTQVKLRSPLLKSALNLAITRVVPDIDTQLGTFVVRVAIPSDKKDSLTAGAFVTATVMVEPGSEGVIVPQRAVVTEGNRTFVMLAAGGKMQKREVQLGDRLTEGVIVRSGVGPDDRIVSGPAEQLKDGAALPAYLQQENR